MRLCLLLLGLTVNGLALQCKSYHYIRQGKTLMQIIPSVCASAKYCIRVDYSDKDPMKKQGYSQGCDKNDCANMDNPMSFGWYVDKETGMRCLNHRDYGNKGRMCCCNDHMCNSTSSFHPLLSSILLPLLLLSFIAV